MTTTSVVTGRGVAVTGVAATLAAMAATTLAAALAKAAGVDFELPDGGDSIPLPGFATVTGFFSVVGVLIAGALLRWSAHPARAFVRIAGSLTALSLVAPLLSGANAATTPTARASAAAPTCLHIDGRSRVVTTGSGGKP